MQLDQKALQMSSQYLSDCMKRRQARTAPIVASLVRFLRAGDSSFQALHCRLSDDPTGKEIAAYFRENEDCFAYMVFLPGDPIPQKKWEGEYTPQQQSQILLGIPGKIIDVGEYVFHLHGIFVANSIQKTFCAAFDGQKFAPLRVVNGVYGGTASSLGGVGVSA